MSQGNINYLLELWVLSLLKHGSVAPFDTYKHIYDRIDAIEEGDAPWKCFKTSVDDSEVDDTTPNWKKQEYNIWYHDPEVVVCNMLVNPDFHKEFDAAPYVELDKYGTHRRSDFMSADFAWRQCLYHSAISAILSSLKPAISTPAVYHCPNGHFRHVIFGLGPCIADYPEQIMVAGVKQGCCPRCTALPTDIDGAASVQRNELTDTLLEEFDSTTLWDEYGVDAEIIPFTCNFPHANIHELISSDLLHQAIKGTFKDHLVEWVGAYLEITYEKAEADCIMDEIKQKQGHRFKQWTGDNSKALMKVYLPAIHGLMDPDVVKCVSAFLNFCYLAQRSDFDRNTLDTLNNALHHFHTYCEHSLVHYRVNIQDFGAPNGLCSSITESRHITAVKKPWRRSSRFEALGQMLITNQRLDKLAAAQADFIAHEILPPNRGPLPGATVDANDDEGGPIDDEKVMANVQLAQMREHKYPSDIYELANYIETLMYLRWGQTASNVSWVLSTPAFPALLHAFLDDQLRGSEVGDVDSDSDDDLLQGISPISVYHPAVASFYAPSDPSGIRGMHCEWIWSTPSWRSTGPRHDCVFVVEKQNEHGFWGMSVVHIKLFFLFSYEGEKYLCTLVEWFKKVGQSPNEQTDTILRGAHLIPVYGSSFIPPHFCHYWSLDAFRAFFVNKYADHHANEVAF
ncbi:hypothetical protein BYT27DRAFT_7256797 [Phlegmacium glaucopus]|nr:hypothetical protein BYT27DRAFT_7256797 [Phlegmacium glaucopus]